MPSSPGPISKKLGTNSCPSDDEAVEIEAILVEPTLRIKQLDKDIAELQKAMDKLTQERDELSAYVDGYKALLSPARRLPVDVIQEIFVACMPPHRNCAISAHEAPILLGHICSSWRSISLATPRLWSTIHVVEPQFSGFRPQSFEQRSMRLLDMIKTWLERSSQFPLSISFSSGNNLLESFPHTQLFMDIFIQYSARWQRVCFTVEERVLQALENLTDTDVPILTTLKLSGNRWSSSSSQNFDWSRIGIFQGPLLSRFSLPTRDFHSGLPLRWDQLTVLALEPSYGWPYQSLTSLLALEVIHRCPNLLVCKLVIDDIIGMAPSDPLASHAVELASLFTLEVSCLSKPSSAFTRLLDKLFLPRLQNLAFFANISSNSPPSLETDLSYVPCIARFFARTADLQKLHLTVTASFSKPLLSAIFRYMPPSLTLINIYDTVLATTLPSEGLIPSTNLDDEVFSLLIPTPDNPDICPGLQELKIDNCAVLSGTAIIRFIAARLALPMPALKRVQIRFGTEQEEGVLPDVQSFIQAGLAVDISGPLHIHQPSSSVDEQEWQSTGWRLNDGW